MTPSFRALTEAEAAERLAKFGPNELPSSRRDTLPRILFRVLQEPMLLLLVACGGIYVASGEIADGLLLFGSAVIVVSITLYQEWRSERAIEALRDLSSPRALVERDGVLRRIPGREVVPGDLIHLSEGDRVPADAVLLSSLHLTVDESLLTGEAFSISKTALADFDPERTPPASIDASARVHSGTLVVGGQGRALVTATGSATDLGKIGKSLQEAPESKTRLQLEIDRIVQFFGVFGVGVSIAIALAYGLTRGDWTRGMLAGLAAAMSLLPEEFPVVLAVFFAMGAWRISRKKVLTRRVAAIEALGSISALCVDKTGTLTQNQMTVRNACTRDDEIDLEASGESSPRSNAPMVELLHLAALACPENPFDPMEKAILEAAGRIAPEGFQSAKHRRLRHYPLSSELFAMSVAWEQEGDQPALIACKGAPEAVLGLCRADEATRARVLDQVRTYASQGRRVLAVAQAHAPADGLPERQRDFDYVYAGLITLEDPIRPEVPAAIRECREAGIRVIMLTGDYPETAASIARRIELPGEVASGYELTQTDDAGLRELVRRTSIFARVTPDQKLRIVSALKSIGERVAMTGDGVNDAPSLKWADIGVAMGGRGTDVAREAAAIVLLDDSFSSMVAAIRLGRTIYDNLRKAIFFIIAVHVPLAGLTMLPVLLKLPLLLLPAHIVFIELIIDPACTLVYEAEEEESDVMKRKPRDGSEPIVRRQDLLATFLQGLVILALVLGIDAFLLARGGSVEMARATSFVALILSNLALIFVNRSRTRSLLDTLKRRNRAFTAVASGALALLALVLWIAPLRTMFRFAPISAGELGLAGGAGLVALIAASALRRH